MRDSLEIGAATSADVDRIIKSYFGSILSVLKKMDSRFSDFEDRTCYLETSVNELKKSFANNAGATDGKLRQLENILREVGTIHYSTKSIYQYFKMLHLFLLLFDG